MKRTTTIEIGGQVHQAEVGTIKQAHLGFEDHGIFTAWLEFSYPNGGQSEMIRAWSPEKLATYLELVLKTLDVRDWSELRGQVVFVLTDLRGIVTGIAHTTHDRYLIFQELADA